jgi:hypothetical protein
MPVAVPVERYVTRVLVVRYQSVYLYYSDSLMQHLAESYIVGNVSSNLVLYFRHLSFLCPRQGTSRHQYALLYISSGSTAYLMGSDRAKIYRHIAIYYSY